MNLQGIIQNLPEVQGPTEKKLSFNVKAKWTLVILITFFVLSTISLYGMSAAGLERFKQIEVILGASFGSIISLGIGPIVMASIVLQLLVGSKILDIDTSTTEGKKYFQGLQKLMVFFFILFESVVYVLMGGIQADPTMRGSTIIVITQLCVGGLAILFMDEISTKWGFGSGVSLFIAAGVSKTIFTALFQFLNTQGQIEPTGKILVLITSLIAGNTTGAILAAVAITITILIFIGIIWAQALKIEIPLSFDRLRGYGIKWPLAFFYTSVIPVILVAALAANIQLGASLIENVAMPCLDENSDGVCSTGAKIASKFVFLGRFNNGQPVSGFSLWINPVDIVTNLITGSFKSIMLLQVFIHILFYMLLSTVFAVFWMKTSGMDAQSQAKNIMSSGLTIPGFRKDQRILESVLSRYIMPLTIMGGAAIGLIASLSNVLGAIVGGTSILLVTMIMYQFYQNIAQQHAMDMHPALKKMIK